MSEDNTKNAERGASQRKRKLAGLLTLAGEWLLHFFASPVSVFLIFIATPFRWVSIALWQVHQRLMRRVSPSSSDLPDLGPTSNPEHVEVCAEALETYLRRSSVTNIAITAPYAGGKTSFIKCFFKHRPFRTQTVSLATFLDRTRPKDQEPDRQSEKDEQTKTEIPINEESERLDQFYSIEQSILQQLVYPRRSSNLLRYVLSVFLLVGAAVGYHLLRENMTMLGVVQSLDFNSWHGTAAFLSFVILISLAIVAIKDGVSLIPMFRLNKLNIFSGEIVFDKATSPSLLNKHIYEVCEHFFHNPTDVVIFEDLERFRRKDIFLKLREINKLVNDSLPQSRGPVKFVYAVADDVFKLRDQRTKFFDAIVSLVPVTNSHKSLAFLRRLVLEKMGESSLQDLEPVIEKVAVYINDMRLLNNIVADFKITRDSLELSHGKGKLPSAKALFSFIVYKNYYPEDFSSLHENTGALYTLTSPEALAALAESVSDEVTVKIEKKNTLIREVKIERLRSIGELNAVFFAKFMADKNVQNGKVSLVNGKNTVLYFDEIEKYDYSDGGQVKVSFNDYNQNTYPFRIVPNEDLESYRNRLNAIHEAQYLSQLNKELSELKEERRIILDYSLTQILKKYPEFSQHLYDDKKEQELLFVLVRFGYLDGRYSLYTTHKHEEDALSGNDQEFVRNLLQGENPNPSRFLSNIEQIIKNVHGEDWDNKSLINYDLIDFLCGENGRSQNLASLLSSLRASESNVQYLSECWLQMKNKDALLKGVVRIWGEVCSAVVTTKALDEAEKSKLVLALVPVTLTIRGESALKDQSAILTPFLAKIECSVDEHGAHTSNDFDVFIEALRLINVKFERVNFSDMDKVHIRALLDNQLYQVNAENINAIAQYFSKECEEEFENDLSWFTENAPLGIRNNILADAKAIVTLLVDKEFTITGQEDIYEFFYNILNSEELTQDDIVSTIKSLITKVAWREESDDVETILIPLITEQKVVVDWGVMLALKESGLSEEYYNFSNTYVDVLCGLLDEQDTEFRRSCKKLLPIEKLTIKAFEHYIRALGLVWNNVSEFSEAQTCALIDNKKLKPTMDCLNSVIEIHPSLIALFIERFSGQLIQEEDFEVSGIDEALVPALLSNKSVSGEFKERLFEGKREELEIEYWNSDILEYLVSLSPQPKLRAAEISRLIKNTSAVDYHKALVREQLEYFKGNERELLKEVDKGVDGAFNKNTQHTLTHSPLRVAICKQLKRQHAIKDYSEKVGAKNPSIVIYLKPKKTRLSTRLT